jgi:hypothetical protein
MIQPEPTMTEDDLDRGPLQSPPSVSYATWRYFGERLAADSAYCARFGITEAPEPILMRGVWLYTLPTAEPL